MTTTFVVFVDAHLCIKKKFNGKRHERKSVLPWLGL
jgi:hypothetical protein